MTDTRSEDCDRSWGGRRFPSTRTTGTQGERGGWIRDGRRGRCESQLSFPVSCVDRWFKSSADLGSSDSNLPPLRRAPIKYHRRGEILIVNMEPGRTPGRAGSTQNKEGAATQLVLPDGPDVTGSDGKDEPRQRR